MFGMVQPYSLLLPFNLIPSPFGRGKGEGNDRGKKIHPHLDPLPEGEEAQSFFG